MNYEEHDHIVEALEYHLKPPGDGWCMVSDDTLVEIMDQIGGHDYSVYAVFEGKTITHCGYNIRPVNLGSSSKKAAKAARRAYEVLMGSLDELGYKLDRRHAFDLSVVTDKPVDPTLYQCDNKECRKTASGWDICSEGCRKCGCTNFKELF